MHMFARSFSGILIRKKEHHFGLKYAKKLKFDPRKEIHNYADLKRLGIFRMSGFVVGRFEVGYQVRMQMNRFQFLKPVDLLAFRKAASTFAIIKSIMKCIAHAFPTKLFPPGSDWLMLVPADPAVYVYRLNILRTIAVESYSWWTLIRVGSTN